MNKRFLHRAMALLYIGIMVACMVMVVKPGASFFFIKQSIDKQGVFTDAGFAYRYKITVNPLFYRTSGSLLFEDGKALIPSQGNLVVGTGNGNFSIAKSPQGECYLYFSSSDNSDPISNGREYKLFLPISFFSRSLGGLYLLFLVSPVIWFLVFALTIPINRQTLFGSAKGVLTVLNKYFSYLSPLIGSDTSTDRQSIISRLVFWKRLFSCIAIIIYLYVFLEWIFFVTMHSFMSSMDFLEKVKILLLAGLALSLAGMLVLILYFVFDLAALLVHRSRLSSRLASLIPAVIMASLSLLMIDNFTYTMFKFGISTTTGIWRGAYGLLFILLVALFDSLFQKVFGSDGLAKTLVPRHWERLFYSAIGLIVISTGVELTSIDFTGLRSTEITSESQQAANRPNILLLGTDGLTANHLSAYKYERDTTPRLRVLAESSLVAENAFSNSGNTGGSVISIMTSKLPTQTRVLYAPNILMGENAYQHLPGILKQEGYHTVEFGVPNYMDAYSLNLQDGFDTVNGRSLAQSGMINLIRRTEGDNTAYFMDRISSRITERIAHIFYRQEMQNPYRIVTQPVENISDEEKINKLVELINNSDTPVFVHAHLMGTHGGIFTPSVHVFSKNEQQVQPWDTDYYDDAILSFDLYVGRVIDQLKSSGQFDHTILIIYTDHAMQYRVNKRIPLVIHFPGGEHAGRITANVQNLDISPTILDYLGITQPEWMIGKSLINGELNDHRLIFGTGTEKVIREGKTIVLDPTLMTAPFYQFSYMDIIDCQKWYHLDLNTLTWSEGILTGHTSPCYPDNLLSFEQIKQALIERLTMDGFDTSSLRK